IGVADRSTRSVADPLEPGDRAPIAPDPFVKRASLELHAAEVDQAAADLLDAADAFGDLQTAPQSSGCLVEPSELDVRVAGYPRGAREPAQIVVPLHQALRLERVLKRVLEAAGENLGVRQVDEEVPQCYGVARVHRLDPCVEGVNRLLDAAGV